MVTLRPVNEAAGASMAHPNHLSWTLGAGHNRGDDMHDNHRHY
jgi:hypothetical protein